MRGRAGGNATIGLALGALLLLAEPAGAQEVVNAAAALGCGLAGFSAAGPGVLSPVVDDGQTGTVASLPLTQPCDGLVLATFTAELSTDGAADAHVHLRARCAALPPAVLDNCQPGSVVPLLPGEFSLPNLCSCVPESRTVTGAVSLTRGDWIIEALLRASLGDVRVEKSLLSVVVAATVPPPPPPPPPSAGRS
jgi:hypothetical protein